MCRLLLAPAVLLLLATLTPGDSHIYDVATTGQTATANGLSIFGGYTYARKRNPAVTLGMLQTPGGKRQFTYVIFSRFTGNRLKMPSTHCDLSVHESQAADRSTLEAGGQKLTLHYTAHIDHGVIAAEDLSVNGKKVDLHNGRVLLVDFAKGAAWTQVKAELPADPDDLGKPGSWPDLAAGLVEQLRKDNAVVRDFLR